MQRVHAGARTRHRWTRRLPKSIQAVPLLAVLAATGCAPDGAGAASAAQDFRHAIADGDSSAACAMLTPQLREETASQGTCGDQLDALQLPAGGDATKTESYGRNAMVEFDDDTVFLSVSGSGWQVTGAGCKPQGEAPYRCELGG